MAATLVAGLASQLGTAGVTAAFLAAAAEAVQAARVEDDSLACSNLAGLLSHMFLAGLMDCALIFSLLDDLKTRYLFGPVCRDMPQVMSRWLHKKRNQANGSGQGSQGMIDLWQEYHSMSRKSISASVASQCCASPQSLPPILCTSQMQQRNAAD